jgi:hypothetical protein
LRQFYEWHKFGRLVAGTVHQHWTDLLSVAAETVSEALLAGHRGSFELKVL